MNKRIFSLIVIVISGEAIFMLPFLIPRLYRPLILEGWGLTNTDFGKAFFAYGMLAMISYLFGGPFADKFHPRVLISSSLMLTALGGIYLEQFPSAFNLMVTYGFFGVSTILLMWGALIKTTHIAGGEDQRSLAMGILDGGRGLAAAVFASLLVYLVSISTSDLSAPSQQRSALTVIYLSTVAFTMLISVAIWFGLKDFHASQVEEHPWQLRKAFASLKSAKVWFLSIVVLGAYCGYKGIDNYSTYLVNVHKVDLARSSLFTSMVFWLRPVSAVTGGFFADKLHRRTGIGRFLILFGLLLFGGVFQLLLAFTGLASLLYGFSVILFSAAFAYSLRAIYFSVFGDLEIPNYLLGTTAGLVSFVGFMPDIFFGLVTGHLIDAYPGELGFQYAFVFTAGCLFIGAAASYMLIPKRSTADLN